MTQRTFKKILSAVEARPERSNQHEFNGVLELREMLGLGRATFEGHFQLAGSDLSEDVEVTWYDAREAHETRSEFRLYFRQNRVMAHAQEGDIVEFVRDPSESDSLTVILHSK
jgi:hypothetical protein